MSKSEAKETKLEVRLPYVGARRRMYFNRFRVEREGGIRFLQFGLLISGECVDSFSCTVSEFVLGEHKKNLVSFLTRLPADNEELVQWKGVPQTKDTTAVDVINMAYRGEISEICLHGFSIHGATAMGRSSSPGPIDADYLAELRSSVPLLKQVIAALYEEE